MARSILLLGLIIAIGASAQPNPDGGLIKTLTWSGEFTNRKAETRRELIRIADDGPTSPLQDWPDGVSVEWRDAPSGEAPSGLSCDG